jgi:hypothetical protein
MNAFNETVSLLIPQWPKLEARTRVEVVSRCCRLVRSQIGLAPVYVRLGLWVMFATYRVFRAFSGKAYGLEDFSALPLSVVFGLERVLRSSVLLFYFEQPEVLTALGEETIVTRQARFRARRAAELATAIPVRGSGALGSSTEVLVQQQATRAR